MTKLGLDIQEEILIRLQVNDLIRCKSVCKSWYSLISSRRFEKSHLNYNLEKNVDNNETGDTRIIALVLAGATSRCSGDCFNYRRDDECQVVGSSNGLVCISRYRKFLVVNPSTREVKVLGKPPDRYLDWRSERVSGFGYDSSIDDYKVVIGFMNDAFDDNYVFYVLTMKSNVWRSVALESDYESLEGNGILCNGAIHWCTSRNYKQVIVSFDLSREIFKEIPLPKLCRSDWDLGTMKDCLCIFASPNINFWKNEDIEIWVMRSYNVQESWERKLLPPGYDVTCKTIMDYIPQAPDFFNRHVHIWLLEEGSCAPVLVRSIERPRHELHDNTYYAHIKLSTISESIYNYDEHVFVKSLVSPNGTGDDDGDDGNMNDVISLSTLYL